jgi:hypothetical protein
MARWMTLLLLAGNCGCIDASYIFHSGKELTSTPAARGLVFTEVWFPAEDGTKLCGWYIPAATEDGLVALYFHGNNSNISRELSNIAFLNRLGLSVFVFDYRGYGRSQGHLTSENDFYSDARGAVAYLRRCGWWPCRMVYYGRSLGAAIALEMGLECPPEGVVIEGAFTSMSDIALYTSPVPYALFGWWLLDAHFENMEKIGRLHCPILVIHGEKDETVPTEMGLRLFERARDPKTLWVVQGGGHSNAYKVGGQAYARIWTEFLDRLVKGQEGTVARR